MSPSLPTTMRAWRTHEYGVPMDVLQLDEVDVPEPTAGEVLVRALGIPFNLNDLERITGGNMMVRPELPYSPGMETMGIVAKCGPGTEALLGRRVVAITQQAHGGFAEYAICPAVSTFEMPESVPLPDAAALFFPFHLAWLGLFDRAELQAGETVLIHAAAGGAGRPRSNSPATRARTSSPPSGRTTRSSCVATSARRQSSTTGRRGSPTSASSRPTAGASTWSTTTSVRRSWRTRSSPSRTTVATS